MEDNQKILSFANIDIVDYLNKTHVSSDHFLIETQKHNLNKYQNQLNLQLKKLFIANSEPLLGILDTYSYCYSLLESLKLPRMPKIEPPVNISGTKCQEFKRICKEFKDNMDAFITDHRYLVASECFNEYLVVLTNDLIFIGEKRNGVKSNNKRLENNSYSDNYRNSKISNENNKESKTIIDSNRSNETSNDNNKESRTSINAKRSDEISNDNNKESRTSIDAKRSDEISNDNNKESRTSIDAKRSNEISNDNNKESRTSIDAKRSNETSNDNNKESKTRETKRSDETSIKNDRESRGSLNRRDIDSESRDSGSNDSNSEYEDDSQSSPFKDSESYALESDEESSHEECVDDKRYDLMHSLSNSIVELDRKKNKLVLRVPGGIYYEFVKDEKSVNEFYDAFVETTYEYDPTSDHELDKSIDKEYLNYLVKTEQVEMIVEYLSDKDIDYVPEIRISSKEELRSILSISKNSSKFFNTFVTSRFKDRLGRVNKIQILSGLIKDSFDILEVFVGALENLCEELSIPRMEMVLSIEALIQEIFDSLEKRIFNKFYQIKINNESIGLIKERLLFKGYDFRYMVKRILSQRENFAKKCVEKAKVEISEHLDSLFRRRIH